MSISAASKAAMIREMTDNKPKYHAMTRYGGQAESKDEYGRGIAVSCSYKKIECELCYVEMMQECQNDEKLKTSDTCQKGHEKKYRHNASTNNS